VKQCADPLTRDLAEDILAYRVVGPTLCHLMGLRGIAEVLVMQGAAAFAFLLGFGIALRRAGASGAYILVCLLLVATTNVVMIATTRAGVPDILSHLALIGALLVRNIFSVPMLVALSILNDERAVFSLPGLLIAFSLLYGGGFGWQSFRITGTEITFIIAATLGVVLASLARYALSIGLIGSGIKRPQIYEEIFEKVSHFSFWTAPGPWAVNLLVAFRAAWVAIVHGISKTSLPFALINIAGLMLLLVIFAFNGDVQRSAAFLWPYLLIALITFLRMAQRGALRFVTLLTAANLLTPYFFLGSDDLPKWTYPLPLVLFRDEVCNHFRSAEAVRVGYQEWLWHCH
jgi:hypothetical protein